MMPGAIRMMDRTPLPPDIEWVWSAQQSFTAYIVLYPVSAQVIEPQKPREPTTHIVGTPDWNAACAKKYLSFDPHTGMFTGKSGAKHMCKLP